MTTDQCPGTQTCQEGTCVTGGGPGPDGPASPDGSTDGVPCSSFATLVDTCGLTFATSLAIDGPAAYDTGSQVLELTQGSEALGPPVSRLVTLATGEVVNVLAFASFSIAIGGQLRVTGPYPVAVVTSAFTRIDGLLDVSSVAEVRRGAGAREAGACGASAGAEPPLHTMGGGAPGGGGGGFGGAGGNGQDSDANEAPATGARGGTASAAVLLGGCPGGRGGTQGGAGPGPGGAGGAGGGAVYLATDGALEVRGVIHAGGSRGEGGGLLDGGGGGGGSGGLIVLEARGGVIVEGTLAANGGGGGGGASNSQAGTDGQDGQAEIDAADGGLATASGGGGGDGSGGIVLDGETPAGRPNAGGGGGGGGAGRIILLGDVASGDALISPPPGSTF